MSSAQTNPTAALTLDGLRALVADPDTLAELAPLLRNALGIDGSATQTTLHSTEAAAERLCLHPRTVSRMAREGRIAGAVKVGATWRIPAGAVPTKEASNEAPALPVAPRRPRRGGRPVAGATDARTSAANAMDAGVAGRLRRTTTPRSAPATAGTARGRGPTGGSPMDSSNRSGAERAADVVPMTRGDR